MDEIINKNKFILNQLKDINKNLLINTQLDKLLIIRNQIIQFDNEYKQMIKLVNICKEINDNNKELFNCNILNIKNKLINNTNNLIKDTELYIDYKSIIPEIEDNQYDNILNIQRKQLFKVRKEILTSILYEPLFRSYIELSLDEEVDSLLQKKEEKMQHTLELNFNPYFFYGCKFLPEKRQLFSKKKLSKLKKKMYKELWISKDLRFAEFNFYQFGFLKDISSLTFLSILDFYWTEHIERMSYIRDTIAWRSYGQQNPLMEYNKEAVDSFKGMFEQIRSSMIYYLLNNPLLY